MKAIEVKNLNVWYGRFHALKDLNFDIPAGVIAGLVGPNGAGKTTLMKAIMGLLRYHGEIKISSSKLGYLSEEEGYYAYLTGYEYLHYFGNLYEISDVENEIKEVIKIVGLEGREGDLIKKYSKGMKRRLGIARTLLSSGDIIILDEPMSGLDPKIKSDLRDIIIKVAEQKTFLISSHQLRDIEEICDWLIMIQDGRILSYGRPEDILLEVQPQRTITIHVDKISEHILKGLKSIKGVKEVHYRNKILTLIYGGTDDSEIFQYLLNNNLKFTLKSDSLESIYREVYK